MHAVTSQHRPAAASMAMARSLPRRVIMIVAARASMGVRCACLLGMPMGGMAVGVRTMFMSVVPEFRFIQQEEKHQAYQQGHE